MNGMMTQISPTGQRTKGPGLPPCPISNSVQAMRFYRKFLRDWSEPWEAKFWAYGGKLLHEARIVKVDGEWFGEWSPCSVKFFIDKVREIWAFLAEQAAA